MHAQSLNLDGFFGGGVGGHVIQLFSELVSCSVVWPHILYSWKGPKAL